MTTEINPLRFLLKDVRCDWPVLFTPQQFNGEGKYRCGAKLILAPDHPQFKQMEGAVELAARTKWKDKAEKTLKAARAKDNVCFRDGDMQKGDGYAGKFFVSANCQGGDTEEQAARPTVFGPKKEKITKQSECAIYRGCYVNALVEVYADSRFGDGVFAKLVGIQFRRDGEAFGSAPAREEDFEDVAEGADAEDFA